METIGERIKRLREELELNQGALAKRVGVSRISVRKWENGETANLKLSNLTNLCRLFNVSVEYLINGKQPKKDNSKPGELLTEKEIKINAIASSLSGMEMAAVNVIKNLVDYIRLKDSGKS